MESFAAIVENTTFLDIFGVLATPLKFNFVTKLLEKLTFAILIWFASLTVPYADNTSSLKKDCLTGAYLGLLRSFQASYFLKYLWTTTFDDSTCHLDYLNHWVTAPILELVGMGVLFQWRAVILSEEEKCGTFLFPFLLGSIHRCNENPVEHLQWSFFCKNS